MKNVLTSAQLAAQPKRTYDVPVTYPNPHGDRVVRVEAFSPVNAGWVAAGTMKPGDEGSIDWDRIKLVEP